MQKIYLLALTTILYGCTTTIGPTPQQDANSQPTVSVIAPTYPAGVLPNPKLTPGAVDPSITEAVVTSSTFTTKTFRNVSIGEKQAVAKAYGIPWSQHSLYEFDHDISIEIGGSNDAHNLWPELLHLNVNGFDMGAKTKDRIEDVLGRLVHSGKLNLTAAQAEIKDWPTSYKNRIGAFPKWVNN